MVSEVEVCEIERDECGNYVKELSIKNHKKQHYF